MKLIYYSLILLLITLSAASCRGFFSAAVQSDDQKPLNVLFISIDDLRNDLGALGVNHIHTPQLDAFAGEGRLFSHHYVQVPTCGSSRAALLRGKRANHPDYLPNTAILDTYEDWGDQSLPSMFRSHGYLTLSLGKITHFPGGLSGEGWAEGPEELPGAWDRAWVPDSPWKTPEDMMHGYANGQPRERGVSPAWEAYDGPDTSYPDGWVANEAIEVLMELSDKEDPWFFAVGFFKPHLPFAAPQSYFDLYNPDDIPAPEETKRHPPPSSWHGSGEMMNNYGQHPGDPLTNSDYARELRHAYAAATSYVDAQAGRVLEALDDFGLNENTVVVIWSDHGFALGEQGIWGKHSLYEVALKAPLIIRYPGINNPGEISDAIIETIDIYPTLADLTGMPAPDGLQGLSLRDQLESSHAPSKKAAYAHWAGGQATVRTEEWRLIVHRPDGETEGFELFDFRQKSDGLRKNPDDYPEVVEDLLGKIEILEKELK